MAAPAAPATVGAARGYAYVPRRVKTVGTRRYKKYKLKTHKGAAARWLVVPHGSAMFVRGRVGTRHLKRKKDPRKRKQLRVRVWANGTHVRRIRKLVPYWKKYSSQHYSRRLFDEHTMLRGLPLL